ncbi:hypothetical protein L596_008485 [Steinernema carpocapsae]|uniref:Uncharacterized protein n=1 Tax=Steinernema carpocapsae TaxID=34508 RepID=A0A4U5PD54_STECR|nr:hypothetical protein L596_008485 [Steinernema carpocapsae]
MHYERACDGSSTRWVRKIRFVLQKRLLQRPSSVEEDLEGGEALKSKLDHRGFSLLGCFCQDHIGIFSNCWPQEFGRRFCFAILRNPPTKGLFFNYKQIHIVYSTHSEKTLIKLN